MTHTTLSLDRMTGMVAFISNLQTDETLSVQVGNAEAVGSVAHLCARIVSTWHAQLEEERRQRQPPPQPQGKPGPKPRFKDPRCPACNGRHRAHTCK